MNKYITTRQLTNPRDQTYVNVGTDEVLLATVCAKGEAPESVEFLKREDVIRRLSEKMQSWYGIHAEGKDPVLKYVTSSVEHVLQGGSRGIVDRKGQLKPISVVVKVRQGRKASTLVTGFEPFFLEGEEMVDELRRLCACATSGTYSATGASGCLLVVDVCAGSVSCAWKSVGTGSACARETYQDGDRVFGLEGRSEKVDRVS